MKFILRSDEYEYYCGTCKGKYDLDVNVLKESVDDAVIFTARVRNQVIEVTPDLPPGDWIITPVKIGER